MTDGLTADRVFLAMARPGYGDELFALGFRVYEAMGPDPGITTKHLHVPQDPEAKRRGKKLVEGALADDGPAVVNRPSRRTERGRTEAEVSTSEADRAARIYMKDREQTPYAVWTKYNPGQAKQTENPKLLSKNMVAHLIEAIDHEWLPWDAERQRLVISGEFRAGQATFVIPRHKPAS